MNWSQYNKHTGLLTGVTSQGFRPQDTEDFGQVAGLHDHLSKRVELETGEVVDYQPPQPSPDYEWDATSKRWRLVADVARALEVEAMARAEIQATEASTSRAIREALLELLPASSAARKRLQAAEDAIQVRRSAIRSGQ